MEKEGKGKLTDKRNASGAADPTAYAAMRRVENGEVDRNASYVVKVLKKYLRSHGFELIGRIPVRHIRSGREYR